MKVTFFIIMISWSKILLVFFLGILFGCGERPEELLLLPGQSNVSLQKEYRFPVAEDTLYSHDKPAGYVDSMYVPVEESPAMLNYGKDVKLP